MSWADFSTDIEEQAKAALQNDDWLGANGTGGILTREILHPQPAGAPQEIEQYEAPYIGVRCPTSKGAPHATQETMLLYQLVIVVVTIDAENRSGYDTNAEIRDRACKLIYDQSGSDWLSTGEQVLIESWDAGEPVAAKDAPNVWTSKSTLPVQVLYPEG